jgi:hypothetical protein
VEFHLVFVAVGRRTLWPGEMALRRATRNLARVGGRRLLSFAIADDHAHVLIRASRRDAGAFAAGLARAFAAWAAPPLERTHLTEVEGRSHLESLVTYLPRQVRKHGLPGHPAAWSGAATPDILGMRVLPGFDPRGLRDLLPRLDVARAVALETGVWSGALRESMLSEIREAGVERLWAAVSAAACTYDGAPARDRHALATHAAFRQLASPFGTHARDAIGVCRRTWERLAHRPVDPALSEAARRRHAFDAWLSAAGAGSSRAGAPSPPACPP